MLWKLLNYDFRSMWKQFSIIWPAALIIALVNRFTLPFDETRTYLENGVVSAITLSVFVGVMIAMFVVSMLFIFNRFHQGLLGAEGYLMHTLPVHSWQLVASKLICAVFVTIINTAVAFLSVFLLFPIGWDDLFDPLLWHNIFSAFHQHPEPLLYMMEFCLLLLAGLILSLTIVYLSMAIGHLFQRHRVLMSVVAFFGIDIVFNLIADFMGHWDLFYLLINRCDHWGILISAAALLLPAALCFAGTSYILRSRLNLE